MPFFKDFWRGSVLDFTSFRDPDHTVKTERTTTVFSGTAEEWAVYLNLPWKRRRNHFLNVHIHLDAAKKTWKFEPLNPESRLWADRLQCGFVNLRKRLEKHPRALEVFHELLFENESNFVNELHLHATDNLPSEATREVRFDHNQQPVETDIVLEDKVLHECGKHLNALGNRSTVEMQLGVMWPILRRVISQLGYPSYPRDRFKDRILLTTRVSFISLQLLYEGKNNGLLKENRIGSLYMDYISQRDQVPKKHLLEQHPYFRMLQDLNFLTNERFYDSHQDVAQVIVRDYLDSRYLRISVAGVMPGMMEWLAPMEFSWRKKRKVETPTPTIGKYGILNQDDLKGWRKVEAPLADVGFVLLRQVGIGQFGRVYEALNLQNSKIPQRVAIKVDRIQKGHKKEAIQAVETIMDISRGLSLCPHVIRIHDAGKLKSVKSTYHVLQFINGDTLDNLIGVTGTEHASVYRPPITRTSVQDLRREYLRAIKSTAGEEWRRERTSLPFTDHLSLSQVMDLMTSILLWLEESHQANFAINDLKNGNLMVSRSGQLKGIDLDTYSPILNPLDKLPDFFFLAVTLLMFLLRTFTNGKDQGIKASGLLSDMDALQQKLLEIWPFGDLSRLSDGRVQPPDILGWMVEIIDLSRNGTFAHEPELFTERIDDLIHLKRNLVNEEMVLD